MSNTPQGHRLRTGRHSQPGRVYLLTAVTEQRQPNFRDLYAGRFLVNEFRRAHEAGNGTSIAWVIMPDHFHWLVELHNGDLPKLMQTAKSRSARAINQQRGRHETLWQKGYFDRALRHEEDLKAAARYIIANPLRAGLVSRVGDYPLWDAMWL
ncbi:REP-associated tyrosine transposase [Pseudomonas vancouverensis]|uniref:REP-associated tyrosine transposase n=1 Tax=Pseudomonas vancouverensis TaxID=95300 RepID=UPI003D094AE0